MWFKKRSNDYNLGIYSFYKSNVCNVVSESQKAVFEKFGYNITQVLDDNITHGDFLNRVLNNPDSPDFLIFFDIDCIPIQSKAISKLLKQILNRKTIAGAAQTAEQFLQGKNMYVGPFFFGISKSLFLNLGSPDMNEGSFWDVGGLLTMSAKFQGEVKIRYWYPTSVETPKWKLYNKGMFGLGTIYNKMVYHAFESRLGESNNSFVQKCNLVINNYK